MLFSKSCFVTSHEHCSNKWVRRTPAFTWRICGNKFLYTLTKYKLHIFWSMKLCLQYNNIIICNIYIIQLPLFYGKIDSHFKRRVIFSIIPYKLVAADSEQCQSLIQYWPNYTTSIQYLRKKLISQSVTCTLHSSVLKMRNEKHKRKWRNVSLFKVYKFLMNNSSLTLTNFNINYNHTLILSILIIVICQIWGE